MRQGKKVNRRSFLKQLSGLIGLALIAPATLLKTKTVELTLADLHEIKLRADAIECSGSLAAKRWSIEVNKIMRTKSYFSKFTGKGKNSIIRII